MAKYRPDIKPPIWGPPDAVQYALRVNSERMGIGRVMHMVPFFETAGAAAKNYGTVGGNCTLNNGAYYSGTTVITDGVDDYVGIPSTGLSLASESWTLIAKFETRETPDSSNQIVWHPRAERDIILRHSFENRWEFGYYAGSTIAATWNASENRKYDFACIWDMSSNIKMFESGLLRATATRGTPNPTTDQNTLSCQYYSGAARNPFALEWDIYCLIQGAISSDQTAQFHSTPYALLMPVARPVYFDLGAGSGILYAINQSLASAISSSLILPADLQASIATTRSSAQDIAASILTDTTTRQLLLSAILTGAITQQQIQSMVATGLTTSHDLRLMLSAEIATLHDTLISISELTDSVVHQDLELRVSSAMAGQADLQAMISTAQTLREEVQSIISTQLATVHDLSVQISELVGTIVRQDLSLTVSTELARVQELAARVSTELSATHDLSGSVATSLTTVQDLLADISSILSIVVRQDLSLAVSTEMVVLQDLLLLVDDHVQALLLGPVFTPRIIDLTPARTLIDLTPLREIREVLN